MQPVLFESPGYIFLPLMATRKEDSYLCPLVVFTIHRLLGRIDVDCDWSHTAAGFSQARARTKA